MLPILLAETQNKVSSLNPGIRAVTNSMRYCDFPQLGNGHDWIDEYKQMTDFDLFTKVKQLFSDLSMRDELKTVARKMLNHLQSRQGGTFTDNRLNDIVSEDVYFLRWEQTSANRIARNIKNAKGNVSNFRKIVDLDRFAFTHSSKNLFNKVDDLRARAEGLGILINQVWAATIEMESYLYNTASNTFYANLKYNLYDDFGLDIKDILGWENSLMPSNVFPPRLAATGFKAWFVLQRYKCYIPFITKVTIRKKVSFKLDQLPIPS